MKSFNNFSGGRRDSAPEGSDYIDARVLAAATSEQITIPAGANYVNFSGTLDFYAKFQAVYAAITVPAADITDGSSPMLNPGARKIPPGSTAIAIIAPAITNVTLEWYS